MGLMLPAIAGAKLAKPEVPMMGIGADGSTLMRLGELEVFARMNIAVPLVIRMIIDDSLIAAAANRDLLQLATIGFLGVVTVNYIANYVQLILVAKTAERILIEGIEPLHLMLARPAARALRSIRPRPIWKAPRSISATPR